MKRTRALSLTALVAGTALVLSSCGGSVGGNSAATPATTAPSVAATSSSSEASSGAMSSDSSAAPTSSAASDSLADTINIGYEQATGGYNCNTAATNSVYCAYVDNVTQGAFVHVQPDGSIKPDTEFGTYEKTSDDPLTVKYTFADKAVWSDGTPIDYDDALLAWAAYSGTHPGGKDADGNATDLFQAASTNGWAQVKMPEGKAGDKSFTMVFTDPYADWEVLGAGFMPAHIAAKGAGLSTDGDGAALVAAIQNNDTATITKIADFWNTGWDYEVDLPKLPDTAILPSSGPYKVQNGSNGNLTLVKNDKWWGTPAKTNTLVFKLVSDQEWVQAMANGEIDSFDPSNVTGDIVDQLKAKPDAISYKVGEGYTFSHIDFDTSPEGKLANPKIRQAFMKCVPRQELVDKFAKPVFDGAQILNLREFLPAQGNYKDILSQVPSATLYDKVDIAGAKALLTEAGVTQPYDIRFIRSGKSSLRGDQVQVIKASCDQAGFNIIDQPDDDVFTTLTTRGTWDVAVFGWSGSGLVASGQSIYVTGGSQNFGGYSDPIVDAAWDKVVRTVDRTKAEELKVPMEEQLWANPYNLTLYANPGLVAFSSKLSGAVYNPTQAGVTWNAYEWTKTK
ncbi:ABC transporter family substrate-binding protein [Nakamurella antarctica]|uniref:ABC transporter family substrate-binding protein n=1 Tax=Nakamurella antarctica TaxID=1902245 RepID=A0A3G8ZKS5_9ACTN|nr:ABC transporter family substrate-binding protein [Nakamurella antarctica]AZI57445.1 ABC transporter family substrate-binding protein [Nakamurella antarctica]